ncbi:MAG: hypothetical protein ABF449_04900 [Ethanoligenens sp.]
MVAAEYLIAMKLMSGRQYKSDLSDVAGILWEHQKRGTPIARDAIDSAVIKLYGGWDDVPASSKQLLDAAFNSCNYHALFLQSRESEKQSKDILTDFDKTYPGALKEDSIDSILKQARQKRKRDREER